METQLVYLSIPQGSLEKLEIVAAKKGLAVEQVIQEAIDEFLERPIHLNSWECAYSARTRDPSFGIPRPLLIHALRQSFSGCARFCCCLDLVKVETRQSWSAPNARRSWLWRRPARST